MPGGSRGFAWAAFTLLVIIVSVVAWIGVPELHDNFGSALPWLAPVALVGALAVNAPAVAGRRAATAFVASSASIASLIAILGIGLYPNLVRDLNGGPGLTLANAASSELSLTVMLVVALIGMPLVLAYTAFIYAHFWGPVGPEAGEGY